jgi:hypothetical protein
MTPPTLGPVAYKKVNALPSEDYVTTALMVLLTVCKKIYLLVKIQMPCASAT